MNTFILGVGIPPQMSIINPIMPQQMAAVPAGMFPMYYAPAAAPAPIPSTSTDQDSNKLPGPFQPQAMQCMMYGQAMYGSPFMYSPIAPPVSYPMHQTAMMAQTMQCSSTLNPLGLTSSNYEEVCVTSELIYKYQILTKTMDEVLSSDKQKIESIEQPSLVNEQLGQLYLDLQLEGVAARLTLEEGITSSSSSGEETSAHSNKAPRRKREYSKLVMIYEEDAPLPPPAEEEERAPSPVAGPSTEPTPKPSTSTS